MTFEQFAEDHGIKSSAVSIPFRTDGNMNDSNMLHFAVTLYQGTSAIWQGNYSVGSGHPVMWAKQTGGYSGGKVPHHVKTAARHVRQFGRARTLFEEENADIVSDAFKKAAPISAATVLESLALDSRSALDAESFEDWADDFGMDRDSRKAEATFEECRRIARTLRDNLGRDAFDTLCECEEE